MPDDLLNECHQACADVAAGTGSNSVDGNRLSLLNDGSQYVPAMLQCIDAAKHAVDLEIFRIHPGRTWKLLEQALLGCANRGIRVRLVVDAVGSRAMRKEDWEDIRRSGIQFHVFHPIRLIAPRASMRRDHRKILIVDNSIAFVGGMSFDDVFFENSTAPPWREVMVRIEGPLIAAIRNAFASTWTALTGDDVQSFDEQQLSTGHAHAQFVCSTAQTPNAKALYVAAIDAARESLWITNPFFMPDVAILGPLLKAAASGIDIQLLLPGGQAFQRFRFIQLAMRDLYPRLLASGIRVFEYQPTMFHAKTIVVDGKWCAVGSSNLDARSLVYNHEADIATCDRAFVAAVMEMFLEGVTKSKEITEPSQSSVERLRECVAGTFRALL